MLRKIRSLVSNCDLIGIYDNALSLTECEELIGSFETYPKVEGKMFRKGMIIQDFSVKKCLEMRGPLGQPKFSDNSSTSSIILKSLKLHIGKYKKRYRGLDNIHYWRYDDKYTFQKYSNEDDGYKVWHAEHGGFPENSNRVLAWMFYLNNAKCGTEFRHYSTIKAKRGRLAIWPAAFTHVHRGVCPNKGLKYIVTGWASFA